MTERYDVVTSRKDKDGKWRSTRIGAAFPKENDRISIVLDAAPFSNGEGQAWLTLFPYKPKDQQAAPAAADDMNDDVPF